MRTQSLRKRIALVLIILTLCFIWGNSLMPADTSTAFSEAVKHWLKALLHLKSDGGEGGSHLIRKLAHWSEFLALGGEVCLLIEPGKAKQWLIQGLSGFMAAGIDETIQRFVPGRTPQWKDVGIDFWGYMTGTVIVALILWRVHRKRMQLEA